MDLGGLNWGIMTIVGPLLLAVVLAWAMLRNRKSRPEEIERTERATRELYKEEDAAHRGEGSDERVP
ncbi:MAG TPA: hypothetical protein VGD19_05835 [Allosphingosinicella sp.]|jgi:hypothetical protein